MKGMAWEAKLAVTVLLFLSITPTVLSTAPAVPVDGRFASLTIGVQIPTSPKWAHDVVLNATEAWNRAQIWYQEHFQLGPVYTFIPAHDNANVTVMFTPLPPHFGGLTCFTYSGLPAGYAIGGVIKSAVIQLPSNIFNATQIDNATDRLLAWRIALHELGHVLGLGETIGTGDITAMFLSQNQGLISTLDLYTIHYLATQPTRAIPPPFITLPPTIPYEFIEATTFLES
jgi:hypothetical protein